VGADGACCTSQVYRATIVSVNDDTGCLLVRYADEGKRGIVDHALTVDYVQAKQTSSAPLSPPRSSSEGAGATATASSSHPAIHQQQVSVAASPTAYLRAMEAERLSTAGQLKAAPRAAAGSSSLQGHLRRGGGATPAPDLPPALSALEERLSEVFHGSSLDGEQEDRFWEAETAVAERRLRLSAAARKKLGAAARQLSGATTGNESRFAKAVLQSGGHNSALF
jgi:hypothetical protein